MTEQPVRIAIGLGANLGDPEAQLREARGLLARHPDLHELAFSSLYASAPVDAPPPWYVNAVQVLETRLAPHAVLALLNEVEQGLGRDRSRNGGERNAPRLIDLDLLLYGDQRIDTPHLTVPHPRMHERAFVLRPLAEVWPDAAIPGRGPVRDWLPAVAMQEVHVR
ncbi:MAG TPA: 2-amino-4-hydroxy-6-hydroxymethyldihydropteridine diphosphokinase [Burkholderiaceae bacterium]|nr:2-amino-4-hydroxy-6-hydroxymethyldihydropteridine diphosphokinase [Burkholderiaceae bacterium]